MGSFTENNNIGGKFYMYLCLTFLEVTNCFVIRLHRFFLVAGLRFGALKLILAMELYLFFVGTLFCFVACFQVLICSILYFIHTQIISHLLL